MLWAMGIPMLRPLPAAAAVLCGTATLAALGFGVQPKPALSAPMTHAVIDGHARFEVISPSLIRLEYSSTDHFENRPTMVAVHRPQRTPYTSTVRNGTRIIRTSALTLRYREGSGRFTPHNVSIHPSAGSWRAHPAWGATSTPKPLGGWVRALDHATGAVALHPGVLSKAGWRLLDDTDDVVLTRGSPGFATRRPAGAYQDGYFFGYGRHYARALRDLRRLSGPAPLLPRKAFGVWFSRYFPYDVAGYRSLLRQFRTHHVALDTLSVDTDWKREANPVGSTVGGGVAGNTKAYSWNGWEWNRSLFPRPARFIAWAHRHGLAVTLNIHPSIDSTDPAYPKTVARAGPLATDSTCRLEQADPQGQCHVFDWTNPRQLGAYLALHRPLLGDGVDFFWLDWCCDASMAQAMGLTPDTWINSRYAALQHAAGSRWSVLSRVGGSYQGGDAAAGPGPGIYAEHRYAIQFTGDTCATWSVLALEARLSAAEGSVGLPYVSDDIGSFNGQPIGGSCLGPPNGVAGAKVPSDLYARWVQLGTFQPLDRLHSNHGERLPWNYPQPAAGAAAAALRLREALVPYLYTVARQAHDTGLPMTRALYLQWPHRHAAYRFKTEYTLGRDVLVAPVTAAGDPAPATVWIPPGRWIDYFTGKVFRGPARVRMSMPLRRMPVLMRAGSVLVTQPPVATTPSHPARRLVATTYPGRRGSFTLYDDHGTGFGYRNGGYSTTRITHRSTATGIRLTIAAANGHFRGERNARSWLVRFVDVPRPRAVVVDGTRLSLAHRWSYHRSTRTVVAQPGLVSTRRPLRLLLRLRRAG